MDYLPSLDEVKQLITDGKIAEAQNALVERIRIEPHNKTAWLWLAQTMPTDVERLEVLEEYTKANPNTNTKTVPRLIEMLKYRSQATPTRPGPDRVMVEAEHIKADRMYRRLIIILSIVLGVVIIAATIVLLSAAGVI
jgi:thioredoxin-like negative regulator of GroEL